MTDYLAPLPVAAVAAYYRRLADTMGLRRITSDGTAIEPLSAQFLRHWLENRDPTSSFTFTAPDYLRADPTLLAVLQYHRAVFLTEQEARVGTTTNFLGQSVPRLVRAGVVPRIEGAGSHTRWDLARPISMTYQSLVSVGEGMAEIVRIQTRGSDGERDVFASLRGFQLRSEVLVSGQRVSPTSVRVTFDSWTCSVSDRYDWDYSEHLTLPNPDFGSRLPTAVRPTDRQLTIYHSNARRLETANLAAPYNVVSNQWRLLDSSPMVQPATVQA